MKTRQITRSALLCALYGLVLFINSMAGLAVETYLPWLFALPVMVDSCLYDAKISGTTMIAMLLMTLMLSGATTWLMASSYLLAGWVFGIGVHRLWSPWVSCLTSFAVLTVVNWISMTLMASLFGFTGEEERALLAWLGDVISWNALLWIISAVLAFTQTLVLYCMFILIVAQLRLPIEIRRLSFAGRISPVFAWLFLASAVICSLVLSSGCCRGTGQDLALIAFFVLFVLMVLDGTQVLLARVGGQSKKAFWMTYLIALSAFIPGVDLIHAGVGIFDLLRQSLRGRKRV